MENQLEFYAAKIHRLISMALVLLFLSIALLQLVHIHPAPLISKKDSADRDLLSEIKKCEICDFIIHKQSKYISLNILQNAIVLSPITITYNCNACICNYDFTLQGFTNKGPPPLYS